MNASLVDPPAPIELPDGLVERLVRDDSLRLDRIADCRRWLAEGARRDPQLVAAAVLRDLRPEAVVPSD